MSAATDRPILFRGPMIRALLAGEKWQTRRLVADAADVPAGFGAVQLATGRWAWQRPTRHGVERAGEPFACPYGVAGQRLWCRETFQLRPVLAGVERPGPDGVGAIYRATWDGARSGAWHPAIFLPRWASRLTLEITRVRVERLHTITTADVLAEGVRVPRSDDGGMLLRVTGKHPPSDYLRAGGSDPDDAWTDGEWLRAYYASLWDEINGKRAAWSSNCWVWVLEFRSVAAR